MPLVKQAGIMMINKAFVLGLVSSLMLFSQGSAQISGRGGPVMMGSDVTEANARDHTQTFTGRVEFQQSGSRLRADRVKLYFSAPTQGQDADGFGDILRMEAEGNIYYITQDQTVKGDRAVYTQDTQTIVVSGEVIVTQGPNIMKGNALVYNQATGQTTLDANPVAGAKGRVKGVFYPNNTSPPKTP
jgi:lipopolysaccharide export system protein LptA